MPTSTQIIMRSPTPSPQIVQQTNVKTSPTTTPTPKQNQLLASGNFGRVSLITSLALLAAGLLAIIVVWRIVE
jgi:hypothetical protein